MNALYTSKTIQNEMISVLGSAIQDHLIQEIKAVLGSAIQDHLIQEIKAASYQLGTGFTCD